MENFLATMEDEFRSQIDQTINNDLVRMAEQGKLTLEHLQEIAKQQYNIAPQEFRHIALSLYRTGREDPPGDLHIQRTLADILDVFLSDWEAYQEFVEVLGLSLEQVRKATVLPGAHYFIAWSHYSGAALEPEQHIAFLYIDWIAFGQACAKIVKALQQQKKFTPEKIKFLNLFAYSDEKLMNKMRQAVNSYAAKSEDNKWKIRWAVRLGLEAEKMFWDNICDFGAKHAPFRVVTS